VLLAFDTATPAVTVALHDGGRLVGSCTKIDARRHGELLAPGITAVLDEAWVPRQDLTAVAVGVGPGPFTGLRVGLVTARTLGLALDIPVYGVCTLDVLAAEALLSGTVAGPFLVATDARRKEVYWAAYRADGARTDGPAVVRPEELRRTGPFVGDPAFAERLGAAVEPADVTTAGLLRAAAPQLADPASAGPLLPLYLRRPDATPPTAIKAVSQA
jgi:tRNA threonylcarbamoyladenosine biosynthesis protein TsaB